MSEHDANLALVSTATLRILRDGEDPNEGEPMTVAERRHRQAEARTIHAFHKLLDVEHTWRGKAIDPYWTEPYKFNAKRYHK